MARTKVPRKLDKSRPRTGEGGSRAPTVKTSAVKTQTVAIATVMEPMVRSRAYEIYLHRLAAGRPGDAVSDWFEAMHELEETRVRT